MTGGRNGGTDISWMAGSGSIRIGAVLLGQRPACQFMEGVPLLPPATKMEIPGRCNIGTELGRLPAWRPSSPFELSIGTGA